MEVRLRGSHGQGRTGLKRLGTLIAALAGLSLAAAASAQPFAPASVSARAPVSTAAPVSAPAAPSAQGGVGAGSPQSMTALEAEVDQAQADLRVLAGVFRTPNLDDAQIRLRLAALPPIQAHLDDAITTLTPRVAGLDARLAQLGPAPGPGQPPELPEIAQNRETLTRIRLNIDSEVKQAKLLAVEGAQITGFLNARLRQQIAARLWARGPSVADPRLWGAFAEALPADVAKLARLLVDEARQAAHAARSPAAVGVWALTLGLALALAGPLRVVLNRLGYRLVERAAPGTRLRRTVLALWLTAVAVVTPVAALMLVRGGFAGTGALTPGFDSLAPLFISAVGFAAFFDGLGRALLSPARPSWRLAPIPDRVVARLVAYPGLIGAAAAVAALADGMTTRLTASVATAQAADCITLLIEIAAVGGGLAMIGRTRSETLAAAVDDTTAHQAESRLPWVLAALMAWLTLMATLGAMLLGYLALASSLMRELVWVATVLAALFLLLRFADDVFPTLVSPRGAVGRFIQLAIGLSNAALEQIAVLLSGLSRLALLLFGWAAILAPFGAGAGAVMGRVTSSQLVFRIGQVTVSPGAILGAVAVFLVGLFLTRAVRRWLESAYLPKTHIDVGLRTSLASGVTYLGGLVALLLTCGYLGLSLDKIALFASALSVGIGFGLQSVIGNFVSGLILLAERPVKVGDWIAIGDLEGDVRKINVRATEIEMQDRSRLIVPNSDLISKTVRNVTHSGSVGRIKIVLRVNDEADALAVRTLIADHLARNDEVMEEPAAAVYLSDVRDGALEFTAFAYVASPRLAYRVRSELLFALVPALKAQGVQLANSTPVVNVGLPERQIEPTPEAAA